MKKILQFLCIVLFTALTFASCVKDPATAPSGGNSGNGENTNTDPPTVTTPSTQFIAFQNYTVSNYGAYYLVPFTLTGNQKLVMRFASEYNSQAAVITAAQLDNFKNMGTFSGYSLFDNKIGTQTFTLAAGDYYVCVRNTSNSANEYSIELDYPITLPASDKCTFSDIYFQNSQSFSNGGYQIETFTVQDGYRYFLDGDNVGFSTYIIPAADVSLFQNNQAFTYYTDYADQSGGGPGLYEVKLAPGNYAFAARSNTASSITYIMERWKVAK